MSGIDTTDQLNKPEGPKAADQPGGDAKPAGDFLSTYMAALGKRGPALGLIGAVLFTALLVVQANPRGMADTFIGLVSAHKEPVKETVAKEPAKEIFAGAKDHQNTYLVKSLDKFEAKPGEEVSYQYREFTFPDDTAVEGTYQLHDGGSGKASRHLGHDGTLLLYFYPSDPEGMGMGAVVLRPRADETGYKKLWYSGFSLGHECRCRKGGAINGPFTLIPAVVKAQEDVPADELARIMAKPYEKADFFFPTNLETDPGSPPPEQPTAAAKRASL